MHTRRDHVGIGNTHAKNTTNKSLEIKVVVRKRVQRSNGGRTEEIITKNVSII